MCPLQEEREQPGEKKGNLRFAGRCIGVAGQCIRIAGRCIGVAG